MIEPKALMGQCGDKENARDYQDLSAHAYLRARRLRNQREQAWVIRSAQDDATELSAQARWYLWQLLHGGNHDEDT